VRRHTLFKLIEIKTGWQTNLHSVLEQTYGFINGLGVAAVVLFLRRRAPPVDDAPPVRRWTEVYTVLFVLVGITYLNLRKNPGTWVKANTVPAELLGLSAATWFNFAYLALAGLFLVALVVHQRRPLPVIPASDAGKAQLLYLVFLWWMVTGNFERAVVGFAPQRLVTEGVIHFNAVACSLLMLLCVPAPFAPTVAAVVKPLSLRRVAALGLLGTILSLAADWAVTRAVWGNQFAGHAALHIRFGSNATATKEKPAAGKPHP
jgi:hypothetical protein